MGKIGQYLLRRETNTAVQLQSFEIVGKKVTFAILDIALNCVWSYVGGNFNLVNFT